MRPVPSKGPPGAAGAAGPAGAAGAAGATGPAGPAPAGDGIVSVTAGVIDTPSTLLARLAADPAAARTALGVDSDWTTYDAADLTLVQGGTSCTAALVSDRLRLTIATDSTRWTGYVSSAWQTDQGPHGWLALPAGVREVIVAHRVYTGSPAQDYGLSAAFLRNGSDPSVAPTAPTPAVGSGVKLAGHSTWGHGSAPFGTFDTDYPVTASLGVAWSATPGATTRWIGVRWTPGSVQAIACDAAGIPTIDDLLVHPSRVVVPAWPAPTMAVFALNRLVGGSAGTRTVDLDVVVYAR